MRARSGGVRNINMRCGWYPSKYFHSLWGTLVSTNSQVGMRRSPQNPSGFQVVLQRLFALVPTVSAVSSVRDSDRTSSPGLNPALEGSLASMFVPLKRASGWSGSQGSETGFLPFPAPFPLPLAPLVPPELVAGSLAGVLVRSLSDSPFPFPFSSTQLLACRVRVVEVQVANGLVQGPVGLLKLRAPAQLRVGASGSFTNSLHNPSSGTWLPRPQQGSSA